MPSKPKPTPRRADPAQRGHAYHQLMRACGLTGPVRTSSRDMEYWSAPTDEAVEAFEVVRGRNQLPFNAMIYRHRGPLCIGVFLDMVNPDYRPTEVPAPAPAGELVGITRAELVEVLSAIVPSNAFFSPNMPDTYKVPCDVPLALIRKAQVLLARLGTLPEGGEGQG